MKKKPYIRYAILGLLVLLMAGCIIRIAMPNREWNYTGSYTFAEGESCAEEPVFEHISLGTGVYRVELSYECTGDVVAVCNVKDGTVYQEACCATASICTVHWGILPMISGFMSPQKN